MMSNEEIHSTIIDYLKGKHGEITRIQNHDAPEWFGDGWMISFEVRKGTGEKMPVTRVAYFRDEEGKPVLAKEFAVRDADGNYPPWRSIAGGGLPDD
jgi:hypothetical protein